MRRLGLSAWPSCASTHTRQFCLLRHGTEPVTVDPRSAGYLAVLQFWAVVHFGGADIHVCHRSRQTGMSAPPSRIITQFRHVWLPVCESMTIARRALS